MAQARPKTVEIEAAQEEPLPTRITNSGERRLGRYQLCFEIASGGMATVFLARADGHAGFDKMVALKRIHPHLAKENNFVQMFLDEARIAARIGHPNVCNVFDFGEANGTYYIAMEYLEGEPLSKLLKAVWKRPEHKESPRLSLYAARIVADAAEGLHAAHELRDDQGEPLHVVHRDVSPHNLFVTFGGGVKVVDFGIASARNRLHQTNTGEVKGKFAYMAPEQLRGKSVDRRADVWSLGVVLWEMVAMKRLFRRETEMETIFAVASETIPRPSSVRSTVSPELEEIVMKALARDPDQRYATGRELGKDLLKFMAKRGESLGAAELAEWMEDLFPEGAKRKIELLEIARQINDEGEPERLPGQVVSAEASGVDMLSGLSAVVDQGPKEAFTFIRSRKRLLFGALGVLMVGIALLFWLSSRSEPVPQTPTASVPQAPKPAPKPAASKLPSLPKVTPQEPSVATNPTQVSPAQTYPPKLVEVPPKPKKATPLPKTKANTKNHASNKNTSSQAAQGTGVVNVVTPGGWAYVLKDGARLGQTPARITLPAGKHVLEIRPFGEPPSKRVTVEVKPNEVNRLSVRIDD